MKEMANPLPIESPPFDEIRVPHKSKTNVNVRFLGVKRRDMDIAECPLRTQSGQRNQCSASF